MNSIQLQALRYVKNTNGGATRAHFEEDHEPIGPILWQALFEELHCITVDHAGRIFLTDAGRAALAEGGGKP